MSVLKKMPLDTEAYIFESAGREPSPAGDTELLRAHVGTFTSFQYRTFIHCRIPIYRNKDTGLLHKPEITFSRRLFAIHVAVREGSVASARTSLLHDNSC